MHHVKHHVKGTQGQSAAGAALLLAVVLGLLIGFVILISSEERAELLGDSPTREGGEAAAAEGESLLTVSPGRIDFLGQRDIEHPLPVVQVYTTTESTILAERNLLRTQRGIFSDEQATFAFSIPDLEHTKNVLLSFTPAEVKGRLIIRLNGEELFNSEVLGNIAPIPLPKNLLQQENELVFHSSSVGLAFWATNEAVLETARVVGDVTDLEAQESRQIFLISETEKNNVEKVVLRFQPDCLISEVGPLMVRVNGNEIYRAVPDCDVAFVPIEFSPGLIRSGENEILFRTERGTYVLSQVQIRSELEQIEFPTFYFELSNEEYEDVQAGKFRVRARLDFVDVVAQKAGELNVNGEVVPFDTREVQFVADISGRVVRGNNAVKIKPRRSLEVRELKVELLEN